MNVLEVNDLVVRYGQGRKAFTAVDGVSFTVAPGEVMGLVGESGSGKSTVAKAVAGLLPIASGSVAISGERIDGTSRRARRERASRIQMIFQDPFSSLDPRMSVASTIGEALAVKGIRRGAKQRAEIERLLDLVSLDPSYSTRLPRQLSGGQRQRVAIARALAVEPRLIVADEITSALDVSVQALILNLIREIQQREQVSLLFISHNLATVRYLSDHIGVMYQGKLVEYGSTDDVVLRPRDAYTRDLLAAVPEMGDGSSTERSIDQVGVAPTTGGLT